MGLLWPFGIPRMPLLIWLPPWPLPLLLQGIHRLSGHWVLSKLSNSHRFKKKTNPVLIRPGGFSRASECSCPMAWWPSRCRCGCPSKFFTPPGLMGLMFQVSNRRLENSTSWHRGETPCAISRSFWDWLSQSMSNPISKQWIRDSCSFCTAGHQ